MYRFVSSTLHFTICINLINLMLHYIDGFSNDFKYFKAIFYIFDGCFESENSGLGKIETYFIF